MSQTQYLSFLEREINKLNKVIDYKIIHQENYSKEARDHKLLLKKVRYHSRSRLNFFQRFFQVQKFQF
ncbi:MAG: hypothetical protein AAB438_03765 [Patescibacteria group bacterium]